MQKHLFFLPLFFLLFTNCQTSKKFGTDLPSVPSLKPGEIDYREGRFEIEDKVKKKTHSLKVETFILPSRKMRLEASGPLGIRVASVVVSEEKIQALLYREKKFMEGLFPRVWERENPTLRVVSIPASPSLLQAVILNEKLVEKSWACKEVSSSGDRLCQHRKPLPNGPHSITWTKDQDGAPSVIADSPSFKITWSMKETSIIKAKDSTFVLKTPENYESVDITPR